MTTRNPTTSYPDDDDRSIIKHAVTGLLNGDDSAPIRSPQFADRSVQITGTLGAGGTVLIEGSNDGGTTWHTLNDPQGVALSINALKVKQVGEVTELLRARVSAGDGTTNLSAYFLLRRPLPART